MKKFIAFLFTVIITAGLTFVLVSSNFFMFNLVIKNKTKAIQEMNEVIAGFDYSKFSDMTVSENIVNGEDTMNNQISVKFAYNETYGFDFAGHKYSSQTTGSVEEVVETDFYYVDGILYINNPEAEEKSKSTRTLSSALDQIFLISDIVLIQTFDVEEEFNDEETVFSTGFAYSFKPFYVGLAYSFQNGTPEDLTQYTVTFKIDMLKNYRGVSYDVRMGTGSYFVSTNVLSYNKTLTLTVPTDLDTYVEI